MRTGKHESDHLFWTALALVAALTAVRIAVLVFTPLQLYPDEAQYWWWAQTPDFGYFSKPPLVAWIIWGTTALFGDSEWAIRLAAPLFHAGTALMLYAIGRRVGGARIGFWSALAYATVPGVSYSSGLISTDVPLLFFWAVALYAFLRALDEAGWRWPLLCGMALGYGLLAKYAMLFFVAGAVLAAVLVPRARALVFGRRGAAIFAVGLLLLAPNLVWNATHGFPTLAHTEANAGWGRARFEIARALEFFGGQFGVFGPLLMAGFLAALWRLARVRPILKCRDMDVVLAAFALPALLIITVQAFISEANANWAAAAYIAATPLAVAVLADARRPWGLWASFAIDGLVMAALSVVLIWPAAGDAAGVGNALKREQGWRQLGAVVARAAEAGSFVAIAAANRSVMAELTYYARPRAIPLRMWGRERRPNDHFQMTMRLMPGPEPVLLVLLPDETALVLPTFESVQWLRTVSLAVGGNRTRVTLLYDAHGYRGYSPGLRGGRASP